jgi:hypothetical protein
VTIVASYPIGNPGSLANADARADEIRSAGGTAEVKADPATDSFRVHVPDEK